MKAKDLATTMRCPYEVLGLEKTASDEDVRSAYKRLALRLHPDKNRDSQEAAEQFKEVRPRSVCASLGLEPACRWNLTGTCCALAPGRGEACRAPCRRWCKPTPYCPTPTNGGGECGAREARTGVCGSGVQARRARKRAGDRRTVHGHYTSPHVCF